MSSGIFCRKWSLKLSRWKVSQDSFWKDYRRHICRIIPWRCAILRFYYLRLRLDSNSYRGCVENLLIFGLGHICWIRLITISRVRKNIWSKYRLWSFIEKNVLLFNFVASRNDIFIMRKMFYHWLFNIRT